MKRDPVVGACREDQRTIVGGRTPRRQRSRSRASCATRRRSPARPPQVTCRRPSYAPPPTRSPFTRDTRAKVGLHLMDPRDIDHLARIPDRYCRQRPEAAHRGSRTPAPDRRGRKRRTRTPSTSSPDSVRRMRASPSKEVLVGESLRWERAADHFARQSSRRPARRSGSRTGADAPHRTPSSRTARKSTMARTSSVAMEGIMAVTGMGSGCPVGVPGSRSRCRGRGVGAARREAWSYRVRIEGRQMGHRARWLRFTGWSSACRERTAI